MLRAICIKALQDKSPPSRQGERLRREYKIAEQVDSTLVRKHQGTGLGLSICRKPADMLDGKIQVQSAWGAGGSFSLVLPLNREGKRGEKADSDHRG